MAFDLHPRLASGGFEIGKIGSCRLLLKNNALFPWFILVPEVDGIEDLHQLPADQFDETMTAMRRVSQFVADHFQPEKVNIGCIGIQVRQLHIHIVGRSHDDPAWPGTVWASTEKRSYTPEEAAEILTAARESLAL